MKRKNKRIKTKMSIITKLFFKTKYMIILLRKHQENLFVVGSKTVSNIKHLQKGKEKKYIIDVNNPCFIKDNVRVYYIDVDSGSQYHFNETTMSISPSETDAIIGNKIIRELVAGVLDNKKMKLMYFVAGCVMGLLAGLLIMQIIMGKKVEEILTDNPTIPTPFMLGLWL